MKAILRVPSGFYWPAVLLATLAAVSAVHAFDFVTVPAGPFYMGRDYPDPANCPEACFYDDEVAGHWVDLPEFQISRTEISNAEYVAFLNAVGVTSDSLGHAYIDASDPDIHIHYSGLQWQVDAGWENHPMIEVSWYGADAYCRWAGGCLPSEAEWEKVAGWDTAAGRARMYPWGETFTCGSGTVVSSWVCNNPPSTRMSTRPVGYCVDGASPYGLYDMAGNVWEWTMGGYLSYPGVPASPGPFTVYSHEGMRGGSWRNSDYNLRTAVRGSGPSGMTEDNVGFRIVYSAVRLSPPAVVVPPRAVYNEWTEDFSTTTAMAQTYTWWAGGTASYAVDTANGWMVATVSNYSNPSNISGEFMGMIRRDTGGLFAPGDYVDITARIKYDRGDRAYDRSSVAVAWGDTRTIVPGGRGADENTAYPWFLIANNTDAPVTWHEVTVERLRWGSGKFCIGFGLWSNLSGQAVPPIPGKHSIYVDWVRVRHSQPWSPGDFVDFSRDVTSGVAPLTVQFTDLSQMAGASAWFWEFGDGQTSPLQNPSHTYTAGGTYTVRLTATGSNGSLYAQKSDLISVTPELVDFSANPVSGPSPLAVQFTDQSMVNGAIAWYWEFGDGQTSELQNPSHTYTSEGRYTVRLTVTGANGPRNTEKSDYIAVSNPIRVAFLCENEPINSSDSQIVDHLKSMGLEVDVYDDERSKRPAAADIAASHALVVASSTVLSAEVAGDFRHEAVPLIHWEPSLNHSDREALADGAATIAKSQIYVSDNSHPVMAGLQTGTITVTTASTTLGYNSGPIASGTRVLALDPSNAGRRMVLAADPSTGNLLDGQPAAGKRVSLFLYDTTWPVTTETGRKIFDNAVTWCLGPVAADFLADHTAGAAPLTVRFTDHSSGPTTAWNWTFGDGQTSAARNPTHTYTQPGTYTVSLTATGPGQASTQTRTGYIVVGLPAPADLDSDGDVDHNDLALFQSCSSGPTIPPGGTPLCQASDFDHDNDVDQSDFGIFQACVRGTNVPAGAGCGQTP